MTAVLSIIGHQGSGKTTLIKQLVPILSERGYRMARVKHVPGRDTLDTEGKDSAEHRAAGVEQTLVVGRNECGLFFDRVDDEPIEEVVYRLFAEFDIVLVEGFKMGPFPKMEVYRRSRGVATQPLVGDIENIVAVVTDETIAVPDSTEVFAPCWLENIADFVEDLLEQTS